VKSTINDRINSEGFMIIPFLAIIVNLLPDQLRTAVAMILCIISPIVA